MINIEFGEQNIIAEAEKENKLLHPSEQDKDLMQQAMLECFKKDNIRDAIIIAGEMALAGFNVRALLQEDQINKMKEKLQQLRERIKSESDPNKYIDLARHIYRFRNMGIDIPEFNDHERKILENLPDLIRTGTEFPRAHLAYVPQIARALNQQINDFKKATDSKLLRKEIESDITAYQGDEHQFHSMIIGGGLLAQFDRDEAKKLLKSKSWKDGKKWPDIINYFEKIKQENNGWYLARLLPPMQSLIRLHHEKNSN